MRMAVIVVSVNAQLMCTIITFSLSTGMNLENNSDDISDTPGKRP